MQLISLIRREIPNPSYALIGFSVLTGISNACLIAVINGAAQTVSDRAVNWRYTLLYALLAGIFFYSKKYTLDQSSELVEWVINRLRHRLADKVRRTELSTLNKYGTATIYARISQDATIISNVTTTLINSVQSVVMVVFTLLYVAMISLWSFVLIGAGLGLGISYYLGFSGRFRELWQLVSVKETAFYEKLDHILKGFKEIRINRRKNEDVFRNYEEVNNATRDHRIRTSKQYNLLLIFTQVFFYLMLGVILFVLPKFHTEHADAVIKVVTALLFISGPLEGIIFSMQSFANANNSAANLLALEAQLEEELKQPSVESAEDAKDYEVLPFSHSLEFRQLSYAYPQVNGNGGDFRVGPLNLRVNKGELIFIIGGNGSGKSTFMHLLTGLYRPSSGSILLDGGQEAGGRTVAPHNYQQYRNLYSIIFSDYHLFDRLYGLELVPDEETVNGLMQSMGLLAEKVHFQGGAFSTTRLSSGQKKRLALVTSIVENKSIYVYDEVAADLDPEFRDEFYYRLLGRLKAMGKTVFVVSHDQQYWLVADRLLNFQDGQLRELGKEEVRMLVSVGRKEE